MKFFYYIIRIVASPLTVIYVLGFVVGYNTSFFMLVFFMQVSVHLTRAVSIIAFYIIITVYVRDLAFVNFKPKN